MGAKLDEHTRARKEKQTGKGEQRGDLGDPQRSYNIGLSARGQLALQKYDLLDVAREYAKEVKGRCDFDKDGKPVEKLAQKKFDTQVLQRDRLVAAFLEEVERNYSDVITVEHGVAVNSCTFSEAGDKALLCKFLIVKKMAIIATRTRRRRSKHP